MDDDLPEVVHDTRHKIIAVVSIALVACFLVAIVFAFTGQSPKKTQTSSSKHDTTSSETDDLLENDAMLVQTQFMFAKIDTTKQHTEIYRRPPGRDVSTHVTEIPGIFQEGAYTRLHKYVAFAIGGDVYASGDGGESFKKIYSSPAGEEVTSVRFSKHKAQLLVAVTHAYGSNAGNSYGNHMYSMEVDGSDAKKVLELNDVGVFIRDWSLESGNILYQAGCNKCEQATRVSALYSLKTKKTIKLPVQDGDAIGSIALNNAGTKVIYSVAFHDPLAKVYGSLKNGYYGPPYEIRRFDTTTTQDRVLMKLGKRIAQPKSYAEIPLSPTIATAGTKYGRQHYYVYDSTITLLYDDNTTERLMPTPAHLKDLLFVSQDQVLATINTEKGWDLVTFDPKTKARQTLFSATSDMIPLGMSDQF